MEIVSSLNIKSKEAFLFNSWNFLTLTEYRAKQAPKVDGYWMRLHDMNARQWSKKSRWWGCDGSIMVAV